MPISVLIAGCATTAGEHERLLARAATVHKKHGPFCALLCLEAPTAAAAAASTAAVPEHALAPADAAGRDGISWLRGSGMTQLDGLVVAYVYAAEPTDDDLAALLSRAAEPSFRGVDLLLTRSWPRAVHRELGAAPLPMDGIAHQSDGGSEALAKLAVALRPRYHFCASADGHWQRPPYQLPHGSGVDVCRLIALARVQEDRKTKWLHALSVVSRRELSAGAPVAVPADSTACPYACARTLVPPLVAPLVAPTPAAARRSAALCSVRRVVARSD